MEIRDQLRTALKTAMRQRDQETVRALRLALSAIDNAEAIPMDSASGAGAIEMSAVGAGRSDVARRDLTESAMRAIVAREEAELRDAAAHYRAVDQDRAEALTHAAAVLRTTLAG